MPTRTRRARTSVRRSCLHVEALESRELLSLAAPQGIDPIGPRYGWLQAEGIARPRVHHPSAPSPAARTLASLAAQPMFFARPTSAPGHGASPQVTSNGPPFDPSEIRHAYGFDALPYTGSGQTIAIVDAYDDPNIANDLKTFDAQFGLGAAAFTKVNQTGGTGSYPTYDSGWSTEIALDVEWAHAIAPGANILLVEANSSSYSDLLAAVDYARTQANVVSMSWGGREFSGETAYDSHFVAPGVTFVASSGDSGGVVSWPAVSTHVVGVGGTSLTLNADASWKSETGWSGSGGGVSTVESKPSYQSSLNYRRRASPDVAYDADPNTGFYVYDNSSGASGTNHWYQVGGTSAGAPQWAALVALADEGRGPGNSLTGDSQLLSAIYSAALKGDFHDITSGKAGKNRAGVGYDLVTGVGSPMAQSLVGALVSL